MIMAQSKADTRHFYVMPKLQAAGWDSSPHYLNELNIFTEGASFPQARNVPTRAPVIGGARCAGTR